MEKSVFETLFEINVNGHVEKKNGLSYRLGRMPGLR